MSVGRWIPLEEVSEELRLALAPARVARAELEDGGWYVAFHTQNGVGIVWSAAEMPVTDGDEDPIYTGAPGDPMRMLDAEPRGVIWKPSGRPQ